MHLYIGSKSVTAQIKAARWRFWKAEPQQGFYQGISGIISMGDPVWKPLAAKNVREGVKLHGN